MQLSKYLDRKQKTPTAFARQLGVSHAAVVRWLNGTRRPNNDSVDAIEKATSGKVTFNDFRKDRR
jgi:DNA-binding transcriptional regulator YdaS (Cro superfamily)